MNEANMVKESEYVGLALRKKELKTELSHVDSRMSELEDVILGHFEESSIAKLTMTGVTLYVHRQLWAHARDGDKQRAVRALQVAGMDEFVTFNTQSVSALFREAANVEGAEREIRTVATPGDTEPPKTALDILPQDVRDVFEITERVGIRTRKGSS